MGGALSPLPHMPSWHADGQLYLTGSYMPHDWKETTSTPSEAVLEIWEHCEETEDELTLTFCEGTRFHLQNNWFHHIQNIQIKAEPPPPSRSTNPLKDCILTILLYREYTAVEQTALLHSDHWCCPLCKAPCHYKKWENCTLEIGCHYHITGSELWMPVTPGWCGWPCSDDMMSFLHYRMHGTTACSNIVTTEMN
jgi:hypothetical protein